MRIKTFYYVGLACMIGIGGSITLAAYRKIPKGLEIKSVSTQELKDEQPLNKPEDIGQFRALMAQIDPSRSSYLLSGEITLQSKLDTVVRVKTQYVLSKNKEELYYRLGDMEALNLKNSYILIDHLNKQIVVGPSKKVQEVNALPAMTEFLALGTEERFVFRIDSSQTIKNIRMFSNQHVNCRECILWYDEKRKLMEISVAVPDLDHLRDASFDRRTRLKIKECSDDSKFENYRSLFPIKLIKGNLKGLEKFDDYRIYAI